MTAVVPVEQKTRSGRKTVNCSTRFADFVIPLLCKVTNHRMISMLHAL